MEENKKECVYVCVCVYTYMCVCVCVCIAESLCYTAVIHTHCKLTILVNILNISTKFSAYRRHLGNLAGCSGVLSYHWQKSRHLEEGYLDSLF